jgi:hypothetical protein
VAALASCAGKSRPSSPQSEARILAAEQREFDAASRHSNVAKKLVDSYRIDSEVLTIVVDRSTWDRLGTVKQDDAKRTIWRSWREAYLGNNPGTSDRPFLKVEDLQGNDLGSYFE